MPIATKIAGNHKRFIGLPPCSIHSATRPSHNVPIVASTPASAALVKIGALLKGTLHARSLAALTTRST
jgi:hypothetical protein